VNELALFAGAGGGILGGHLLGWRTVCAVEVNTYAASVLMARQNDGHLPPFPIWDDVCTFDGHPWRGLVDVVSGGFPCQDISTAGRGAGITGPKSGLWRHMHRIVCEVRPRFVFVENSAALVTRGLGRVLGDLASSGYDAEWGVLAACDLGAPHERRRIWIVAADADRDRQHDGAKYTKVAPSSESADRADPHRIAIGAQSERKPKREDSPVARHDGAAQPLAGSGGIAGRSWWSVEPGVDRVADGVAYRMGRLEAIGNGQVPAVAARAWQILTERLGATRLQKGIQ